MVAVALSPSAAFAAGTGYTPTAAPTPGATVGGLAGPVVSSTTIQPSGGSTTATIGTSRIVADVPAGAFPNPVQAVVTNATNSALPAPDGVSAAVTFGIGFFVDGTKVTGTFPPITVTVTSPAITAGSTVYIVTGTTLTAVSGATVKNGSATFTITSDPVIEIAAATSAATGTTVPGATSVSTGKPFLLEGGLGAVLVLGGSAALVAFRQRRRPA